MGGVKKGMNQERKKRVKKDDDTATDGEARTPSQWGERIGNKKCHQEEVPSTKGTPLSNLGEQSAHGGVTGVV